MSSGGAGQPAGAGRLVGRLVAVGVTGSIAAYKAVELVRLLSAEGAEVVVLLSQSATRFVAPLTFEALTRHPVEVDVLALLPDGRIGHIVVADAADAIVVAPATAHWLGAMAGGLSGDTVTAACLATSAPVVVAPAMDGEMWSHPATTANVRRLRDDFGYTMLEPAAGPLASGQVGVGRLAELPLIVDAVVAAIGDRPVRAAAPAARPPRVQAEIREADLVGRHVVVTAGGTREAIDPVRFIGNHSSGKMGVAVAEAALDRGAVVTLIAANLAVAAPERAGLVEVGSTAELRAALGELLAGRDGRAGFDALVMAAAVADFTPAAPVDRKLARGETLTLELRPTPDLLAEIGRIVAGGTGPGGETHAGDSTRGGETHAGGSTGGGVAAEARPRRPLEPRPVLVGFAAETGSLERAPAKLVAKGADLLVVNDVTEPASGFGTDTNRVVILDRDGGRDELPLLSKREVADRILDRVARRLDDRDSIAQTGSTIEEVSR